MHRELYTHMTNNVCNNWGTVPRGYATAIARRIWWLQCTFLYKRTAWTCHSRDTLFSSLTLKGNYYIIWDTDQGTNLTRAIPTLETTASHIVNVFIELWIVLYSISCYVLAHNKVWFARISFAMSCIILSFKHFTAIAGHLQSNGPFKR